MKISWTTVAVLAIVVVGLLAVLLVGPLVMSAESYAGVLASLGAVGALVLAVMRPMLARDEDHDGIPDVLQPPKGGA